VLGRSLGLGGFDKAEAPAVLIGEANEVSLASTAE
jgi:hypothetical protein